MWLCVHLVVFSICITLLSREVEHFFHMFTDHFDVPLFEVLPSSPQSIFSVRCSIFVDRNSFVFSECEYYIYMCVCVCVCVRYLQIIFLHLKLAY